MKQYPAIKIFLMACFNFILLCLCLKNQAIFFGLVKCSWLAEDIQYFSVFPINTIYHKTDLDICYCF